MAKDIVFINGIVKSREKSLIRYVDFIQMADAPSAREAFSMLKERGFGGEGFSDAEPNDYEKLIDSEWASYKKFLEEYSPSSNFSACVFARDDFFNAEYAVRKVALGLDGDGFSTIGLFDSELLLAAAGGKFDLLPDHLSRPMKEATKLFEDGEATGAKVSVIFLRAYYEYMLKAVKSAVWKESVIFEIDSKNIAAAIRSQNWNSAVDQLIRGGRLNEKLLKTIFDGEERKALDGVLRTPYYDLVKIGLDEKKAGGSLAEFERAIENFAMKKLKEKRFETEGITPSLVFANYKINELKNARLVIALKLAGADKEGIKRRLRECYEG